MRKIDHLLERYGESHQDPVNKIIHWFCVPAIVFSLSGLLMSIPWPFGELSYYTNWASIVLFLAILYYLRLSLSMFFGFVLISIILVLGNFQLLMSLEGQGSLAIWSLIIFGLAWIGQFIGHRIEGKKPSFFEDIQFLLIGPAWLMHFIFKSTGVRY